MTGVAQRHRPMVLDQDERRRRVVRDLLEHVPGVFVREHLDAVGGRLGTRLGAGLEAVLALDAKPDQRADLGAQLDRLVLRQVAEVLDFELAGGVLVDGQRVDHAYGVALAQSLELGDDLAVEVGLLEAQHDQLNGSNRHCSLLQFGLGAAGSSPAALRPRLLWPPHRPRA
jgi:hypothetical protein